MADKTPDSIIKILDEVTANKIAAGEVVERPASIVKELVENSIDAQATMINIEIAEGGKKLIKITDNGVGMSREDAELSIKRHATSKIRTADDLFSIHSLGFRGEALPSISSISQMQILTKRSEDESGTLINCVGGEVKNIAESGSPVGTSISITDLFFNVPARQKFLKTTQTELSHIIELANRYTISHHYIDISLTHNNKNIFRSSQSDDPLDSILTVLGRDAVDSVIRLTGQSGPYKIHGFISKPSFSKTSRSGQLYFVNKRFIRNRNITHALDEAYKGILPQGRYPLFIGFIEVDPDLVDVNVHPTKIEIKFVKEWEVHNLVYSAIKKALSSESVTPSSEQSFHQPINQWVERPSFNVYNNPVENQSNQKLDLAPFQEALASRIEQGSRQDVFIDSSENDEIKKNALNTDDAELLSGALVLAQARNMYIIAQSPKGVLIIDQHVAHERILYDQLLAINNDMVVQRLAIPLAITFNKRESLVLENKLNDLKLLGFEIESFGKDAFMVRTIPSIIAEKNYERILRDTIEELTDLTVTRRLMIHKEGVVTTTACKMAVKAGDRLSLEEMTKLVSELKSTSNPYLCPHGRPIVICLSNRELDKMFGRI